MKFSKEVIDVLKTFSVINNSIYISEPDYIKTISPASNIVGIFKLTDFEFPKQFGIYDIQSFLSVLSVFDLENTDFDLKDTHMIIKHKGSKVKFYYADLNCLSQYETLLKAEAYLKPKEFDATFTLSLDALSKIRKLSGVMGIHDMKIIVKPEVCGIILKDGEKSTDNDFSMEIKEFSGKGKISLNVENLEIINGTYKCEIITDQLMKMTSDNTGIVYFLSAEI